jgi:diguanylate cyclase (GGDEF)-like protein
MKQLQRKILEQLIEGLAEPVLVARIDSANWPVVMSNPAFEHIDTAGPSLGKPFADVVEHLLGRELAVEISEAAREGQETNLPVEIGNREYLLAIKPLSLDSSSNARYCAAYWRSSSGSVAADGQGGAHEALLNAKRRIRDLSRDDPATGLLNATAFREVLAHDWAVASREKSRLALVAFDLQDFDEYKQVFGRHASDSCQRRVAQAIRRCLRRASDVAARISGAEGDRLVVLSHASEGTAVQEFAGRIAAAVRELGLHHPRSKKSRFVTVTYRTSVVEAGANELDADSFLNAVLGD